MKFKLTAVCAALLLSIPLAAASGPSMKIGLVDLQKALQSVEEGKSAKSNLEKEVSAKRAQLEKQQAALQAEAEQFEKKAAILNDSAKQEKQAELQRKFADLQKKAAESQLDLQKRERDLTQPIISELRAIIEGIGKEKGYTLIVEKNEGAVLYAQNAQDLTSEVIKDFNAHHKHRHGSSEE